MTRENKKAEADRELCAKIGHFFPLYYQSLDTNRDRIALLLSNDPNNIPTLTWNGHHVEGIAAIESFVRTLPPTEHKPANVNPQIIEDGGRESGAIVNVMGNVLIAGENLAFTHVLVMVPDTNGTYKVKDQTYRIVE